MSLNHSGTYIGYLLILILDKQTVRQIMLGLLLISPWWYAYYHEKEIIDQKWFTRKSIKWYLCNQTELNLDDTLKEREKTTKFCGFDLKTMNVPLYQ